MNKSTILALLVLVSSAYLFSGCVVPADGYYSDPYYSPDAGFAPALPYEVILYDRPYYSYRGYYYFYDNDQWFYSRTNGGNWRALPRSRWPRSTHWKGRHYQNDNRGKDFDRRPPNEPRREDRRPPQNDQHWGNKPRPADQYRKDERRPAPDPRQKDKWRHDMNQRHDEPEKRTSSQRQNDEWQKKDQYKKSRDQHTMPPPQDNKRYPDKKREENWKRKPNDQEVEYRH